MNQSRKADLLLVSATILAGFGWVFSKQTISEMPPFMFIGLRFLCAALLLFPFCFDVMKRLPARDLAKASSVGLLQGIALLFWIYSVSISDALGEGAFIMSLSMLFVPLISWFVFHSRPNRSFWIAFPIAVVGLYALSSAQRWTLSGSQFSFLLSALTTALLFNLNSRYSKSIPTIPLTFVQFLLTGLFSLLMSLVFETWPSSFSQMTWIWFIASVIPATCFRFLLQIRGQKNTSATNASIIMILEPVWTVLLSVVIYGEVLTVNKITGGILILIALVAYRFIPQLLQKLKQRRSKNIREL